MRVVVSLGHRKFTESKSPRACTLVSGHASSCASLRAPAPFSDKPGKDSFWFGNERLWTRLDAEGIWLGPHTESGYGDKLFWYNLGLSRKEEGKRRVMVTGRSPVGTVFLPFHFVEAAANLLTLDKIDPRAKIPDFKMAAVKLRKVDAPADRNGSDVPLTERGTIKDPTTHVH